MNEFYEQKEGDASCQPSMTPVGSTGAGQSNPESAPTPRTDAVFRDDQTGVLPSNWTMADFARQLERELADHHALVVYYERKWKEVRDELASVKLASQQPRWIPYSERAPTKADGVALDPGNNTLVVFRRNKYGEIHLARWDYETGKAQHWCRIVLPPELEPEPQSWGDVREGEMDKAAFEKWRTSKPASDEPITQYDLREAWRAALAHARGESK